MEWLKDICQRWYALLNTMDASFDVADLSFVHAAKVGRERKRESSALKDSCGPIPERGEIESDVGFHYAGPGEISEELRSKIAMVSGIS